MQVLWSRCVGMVNAIAVDVPSQLSRCLVFHSEVGCPCNCFQTIALKQLSNFHLRVGWHTVWYGWLHFSDVCFDVICSGWLSLHSTASLCHLYSLSLKHLECQIGGWESCRLVVRGLHPWGQWRVFRPWLWWQVCSLLPWCHLLNYQTAQ